VACELELPLRWTLVTVGCMPESHFDEWIAARYETLWPELFDPAVVDPAVSFLAELAAAGPALEFGIGTGRIALPLSRRNVRVHGIELSPAMVAQLRTQPGGQHITVTIGDFATTTVGGPFALVYLLRNTITNLTTQDEQVHAFGNAAAHLRPGGCFVIELHPRATTSPAGPDHARLHSHTRASGLRGVRRRRPDRRIPPLLDNRRPAQDLLFVAPLCMALRAGPHGAAGRPEPA
jgi:SAM-dependent methyltransferase